MPEQNCPFCGIDEERNRILEVCNRVVVILSNPWLIEGHTLVIPKRHAVSLSALTPDERNELFGTAIYFQEKIKRIFSGLWGKPAGCDFLQHDRPFMPTTKISVPGHVHIHLLPRSWEDDYYQKVQKYETSVFQELGLEEREKFQNLLAE